MNNCTEVIENVFPVDGWSICWRDYYSQLLYCRTLPSILFVLKEVIITALNRVNAMSYRWHNRRCIITFRRVPLNKSSWLGFIIDLRDEPFRNQQIDNYMGDNTRCSWIDNLPRHWLKFVHTSLTPARQCTALIVRDLSMPRV